MTKRDRVLLAPGQVLASRPYRNTSALLEVFTRDHGKVAMVARGARRPSSGLQAVLQPFQPLLLSWAGRGDLMTLTAAELGAVGDGLNGRALYCGYYLNELLLRLLGRHDAHQGLYHAYERALTALAQATDHERLERTLRLFEKQLLRELGYGLLLDREADGGEPVQPQLTYEYELEKGPVREGSGRGVRVQGSTLLALARDALQQPDSLREAKSLMRAALSLYLGDKPLKSREFFRQLSNGQGRV